MSKIVSQHTIRVRENHPVFPPGLVWVSVYQADVGHYYVRVNDAIVANYMTRQMAEDYVDQFTDNVSARLVQRVVDLRLSMGRGKLSLLAAKRICEANLDSHMTGDYAFDIELLATHLKRD